MVIVGRVSCRGVGLGSIGVLWTTVCCCITGFLTTFLHPPECRRFFWEFEVPVISDVLVLD